MKVPGTRDIRFFTLIIILIGFLFTSFVSSPHASTMPFYNRLLPMTSAVDTPTAVATDAGGTLYVTDLHNNRLNVINKKGRSRGVSGLDKPISIAVSDRNTIVIGSKGRGSVEVYDAAFRLRFKLGTGNGEFSLPNAIAIDSSGKFYVADGREDRIKVYDSDGSFLFSFGSSGSGNGQFHFPTSIAIDEKAGEILVVDRQLKSSMFGSHDGARVQIFDMNGEFRSAFEKYGTLIRPMGIVIDKDSRVYITDTLQNGVQVFEKDGTYLGAIYNNENPMRTPLGMTISQSDILYIASLNTRSVEVYQLDFPMPEIAVSPPSHDFGEVNVGTSSIVTFTVSNDGFEDLLIGEVTHPSLPFSKTSDACSNQILAPLETCDINISFEPAYVSSYTGNFTIPSNDPDEGSVSVFLKGKGLEDSSPLVADFSALPTNGPPPLTVTFTNNSMGENTPLSYAWDFNNDGIIDSNDENPSVIYSEEGTYSVSLTVTDALGATNFLTRTDYITVSTASYTLSVNVGGKGSVTGSPSGIDCPGDCSEAYASGAGVVLTATAEEKWRFSGWSGACSGTGSCVVTMDSDQEVTATFECTISFTDLPFWAEDYILAVACEGIMNGYDDGTFGPNNNVTRADMAEFIIKGVFGDDFIYSSIPYLPDVPETHPAFKYIQKMYEEGIATGYDDGTYKPSRRVNRAQMSIFIIRALYGDDFSYSSTPYFPDVPDTHWAFKYIQKMYEEGIATGYDDGAYKPLKKVNRAQLAIFLARAFLDI
jgi:sugar lactone lactonase YvrE